MGFEEANYPQSKDSLDFPCYRDAKLQLTESEIFAAVIAYPASTGRVKDLANIVRNIHST